jgi:hypothetical protein
MESAPQRWRTLWVWRGDLSLIVCGGAMTVEVVQASVEGKSTLRVEDRGDQNLRRIV